MHSSTAFRKGARSALASITAAALLLLAGCQENAPDTQQPAVPDSAPIEATVPDEPPIDTANESNEGAASAADSKKNSDLDFSSIPQQYVVTVQQLKTMLDSGETPFVLDVRSIGEYTEYYIFGSRNIPAGRQIDMRFDEIPSDRTVVIVSENEERVAEVRQTLIDVGYDPEKLLAVEGGMTAWRDEGYPFEHTEDLGC